jgi:hypothetical protein
LLKISIALPPGKEGKAPMMYKTVRTCVLVLVAVLVGSCTIWAQSIEGAALNPAHTLTISIHGTLGPILSGSDPAGLDGKKGAVTVLASESLKPVQHTKNSATYQLPAGAITVEADDNKYTSKSPSKMTITLTGKADILALVLAISVEGQDVVITDTTYLAKGSWTATVLKHPTVFLPSPQELTAAKTADGPGCKLKYTVDESATVLGLSGSASSSSSADPVLPDDDLDQSGVDQNQ